MKIAFAYDSAYPWMNGGVEKRRYIIARHLIGKGHEIRYFTMLREGMQGNDFERKGIRYSCVADDTASKVYKKNRRSIMRDIKYMFGIASLLMKNKEKFDFIDADAFPFLHLLPIYAYCRLTKTKLVVTWHEAWDLKYWTKYIGMRGYIGYFVEYLCSRMTKNVIVNSEDTKHRLEKVFKVKNSVVLPAVIDEKSIADYVEKEDEMLVVCRLIPEKRVDLAIEAITFSNERLTIIGVGPEKEALVRKASELGVKDRVTFMDSVNEVELFERISSAKALLMFSEREGLSMITVEALASGTPVIITDKTNIPEELKKYCIMLSSKGTAQELTELVEDKKSRLYTHKNDISEIKEKFGTAGIDAAYSKICSE